MIIHRAMRDIERCRIKYGEAWKEYERQVPYLFIPVSETTTRNGFVLTADSTSTRDTRQSTTNLYNVIINQFKLEILVKRRGIYQKIVSLR